MLLGERGQRFDDVEALLGEVRVAAFESGTGRYGRAPADLAGQQAVGEREVREHADAVVEGRRDQLALDRTLQQRPLVLRRHEGDRAGLAGDVRGFGELPAGEVGVPDVADLALGDQLGERGQGLGHRGGRVGAVQLEEVDVVGVEAAQGLLHGTPNVGAATAGTGGGPVLHVHAVVTELGGEDDLVAAALEGLPEVDFGAAGAAVDVGGVQEGDARVQSGVDDGAGGLGVQSAAEVVAAEADGGDLQSRTAQGEMTHACSFLRLDDK